LIIELEPELVAQIMVASEKVLGAVKDVMLN